METEMKQLTAKSRSRSSRGHSTVDARRDLHHYTSLRDIIILHRHRHRHRPAYAPRASRSESCIVMTWWRPPGQRAPGWHACVRDPFERCVGFVSRSVSRVLACVVAHLGRVYAWGRTSMRSSSTSV
ncbi:hypothetical protein OPV22_031948 [Ensete ventricosum]|uniref:Uncharacterized protein n=1 Tax=Ensete ventricosum TaxID=4639 RepID=A0AAV8PU42_ENSVE|nr:hypothetical protein OPV22_031948 [Ensete ventricosum]